MGQNIHRIERVLRLGAPRCSVPGRKVAALCFCRGHCRERADRSEKPPPARSSDGPVSFRAYLKRGEPRHSDWLLFRFGWPLRCRGPPVKGVQRSPDENLTGKDFDL